jgi:hypothetical protein
MTRTARMLADDTHLARTPRTVTVEDFQRVKDYVKATLAKLIVSAGLVHTVELNGTEKKQIDELQLRFKPAKRGDGSPPVEAAEEEEKRMFDGIAVAVSHGPDAFRHLAMMLDRKGSSGRDVGDMWQSMTGMYMQSKFEIDRLSKRVGELEEADGNQYNIKSAIYGMGMGLPALPYGRHS